MPRKAALDAAPRASFRAVYAIEFSKNSSGHIRIGQSVRADRAIKSRDSLTPLWAGRSNGVPPSQACWLRKGVGALWRHLSSEINNPFSGPMPRSCALNPFPLTLAQGSQAPRTQHAERGAQGAEHAKSSPVACNTRRLTARYGVISGFGKEMNHLPSYCKRLILKHGKSDSHRTLTSKVLSHFDTRQCQRVEHRRRRFGAVGVLSANACFHQPSQFVKC